MTSTAPRLRRVYTATWRFEVGQLVRAGDTDLFAIILKRLRSANGKEIYEVAATVDDGRPIRRWLGDLFEPVQRTPKTRRRRPTVRASGRPLLLLPQAPAAQSCALL